MKIFKNKKHIILSFVALVLVLMMTVGITYSWIDDIKQVEISSKVGGEEAPLKTGIDINSDVEITNSNTTIDLGKMFTESDTDYTYTEDGKQKSHTKYENNSNDSSKTPNWTDINNKKGYFYESGDMHLSGCYSDGESFYFPYNESNSIHYREGNIDDENVNYISFTARVSSPSANVDFWFLKNNPPTIKPHGSETSLSSARYSITVDGKTNVYSPTGSALTCNSDLDGMTSVSGTRKTTKYTYDHEDNTNSKRGQNGNVLFSIAKGSTVNMTVKIWLEGTDADISASDINFKLVSSWAYTRSIKIVDKTMGPGGQSWLKNDKATHFLTFPSLLKDIESTVGEWRNLPDAPFYTMSLDSGSSDTYTVSGIPLVYNNEEMIVYRCTPNGWNARYTTTGNGDNAVQRSEYNVYCWNWWKTNAPDNFKDNETYTLYGCSLDNSAHQAFSEITATNEGYGTWGGVQKIDVYSHWSNVDYANKYQGGKTYKLFIRDYSDKDTSGIIYTYEMYRSNNNGSNDPWQSYVPVSSSKLKFAYVSNANALQGEWGYDSWHHDSPQQRPLKNDIYSSSSTVYHFTGNNSSSTDKTMGRGFWNGAESVYLIKNGNLHASTAHSLMRRDSTYSSNYEMPRLRNADNTADIIFQGSTPVFKSQSHLYDNGSTAYYDVKFNDNVNGNANSYNTDSDWKTIFPGCFYNYSENKWYGNLNDTGRQAEESGSSGGDSGGDSGDDENDSLEGYKDANSSFRLKEGNNSIYFHQKNDDSNSYKARISLSTSYKYFTALGPNGKNYGLQNNQNYSAPMESELKIRYLQSANTFGLKAATAGNYIVTMTLDEWRDESGGYYNTIIITSIRAESS